MVVARYASVRAGLAALVEGDPSLTIVADASGSADMESDIESDAILYDADGDWRQVLDAAGSKPAVLLDSNLDLVPALTSSPLIGWALLPKEAEREEIVAGLHAAASGLVVFDRSAALSLVRPAIAASAPATETLTAREREILQLMAEGLPNKQIALKLGISLHTVKFHVASILTKLGVESRTEAVTAGVRQGLVLL